MLEDEPPEASREFEEAVQALNVFRERTFDPEGGAVVGGQELREKKEDTAARHDSLQDILDQEAPQAFANEGADDGERVREGSEQLRAAFSDWRRSGQNDADSDGDQSDARLVESIRRSGAAHSSGEEEHEQEVLGEHSNSASPISSSARPRGKGKGKAQRRHPPKRIHTCPTCGTRLEHTRGSREKHFRLYPACRPPEEMKPHIAAGLVLDLSDRLPYRAMQRKDMKLWDRFTSETRQCRNYEAVARQLLWLFRQLRPVVYDEVWTDVDSEQLKNDCDSCCDAAQVLRLVQRLELQAIDWTKVYELWDQERGEEKEAKIQAKGAGKRRRKRARNEAKGGGGGGEEGGGGEGGGGEGGGADRAGDGV